MQHVTIKDIARMAGVSVTTVSRALNDAPEISPETRKRILRLCQKTGYRANLLARSLISSRTNVIGVIPPDISNPFHAAFSLYMEMYAKERGYQVMLCSGHPGDGRIGELFDFLISQRVDGILLLSSNNSAVDLLQAHAALPSVLVGDCGAETSGAQVNAVSVDNYMGGRMAAEYLHRLGHRRVAYLGLRPGSFSHTLRHRGFSRRAEELGMQVETLVNPGSASTIESGHRLALELFQKPFPQTAVFAASDSAALGVMEAADERGIAIPEELSLMGYDNIDYAALPNIRLTTIAQPIPRLARSSVRLLLDLIDSESPGEYTRKFLLPALVERRTCRDIQDHESL
nr:LacI family DNA-binding transcriptional regulator [uncultured Oscillibacter sp.]